MNAKIIKIDEGEGIIYFDNGYKLYSYHDQDCCEHHEWSLEYLEDDYTIKQLKFDLSSYNFFERVEGFGIRLIPLNGYPIAIPAYGYNNGYYTDNLSLILEDNNGHSISFDISDCQLIKN